MTVDRLKELLEAAVKLELSTIPPYLCALYTLHPEGNDEAKLVIRSVVVEEMLHMVLVANVMNALSGDPVLDGSDLIRGYPGPLPGSVESGLEVGLAPCSIAQVRIHSGRGEGARFMKKHSPSAPFG